MCLKSGKVKQMVSGEGSGPDNLSISLFQVEDPSEAEDLWGISLQTRESKVYLWTHDLVLRGQHDHITHAESPDKWNLSSRVNERRFHQSLQTYEESNETSLIQNL